MTESNYDDRDANDAGQDDEAEARKLGWAPREKWRGKPEEFVEAGEFLRRGREVMPILRTQFDRTRAENEKLRKELEETKADFDRRVKTTERMTQRLLEQQRAQMVQEFDAKKRDAAAKGDIAEFDRVSRQERDAYSRIAEENKAAQAEAVKTPPGAPELPDEVKQWAGRNQWFFQDNSLKLEAEALHVRLLQESPGMSLSDNLETVTETLKQRYPQKFGVKPATNGDARQAERGYSAVEGSTSMRGAPSSRSRGWKELPREAKDACEQMIERGYLKGDRKAIQDNYAKTYWEESGE